MRLMTFGVTVVGTLAFASAARAIPSCVSTFNYTGAETTCMVPASGVYDVTAYGGQGGEGNGGLGGLGAEIGGDLNLTAGSILTILVGGVGGTGIGLLPNGGGGTFVVTAQVRWFSSCGLEFGDQAAWLAGQRLQDVPALLPRR